MTQEEKQLLLKVLCAMLPYDVTVGTEDEDEFLIGIEYGESFLDKDTVDKTPQFTTEQFGGRRFLRDIEEIKPYLRPMSSMTKEEMKEYEYFIFSQYHEWDGHSTHTEYVEIDDVERYRDWLNSHHLDYNGLIPKGIALEAPEGMYEI